MINRDVVSLCIEGFVRPVYKGFDDRDEALAWLRATVANIPQQQQLDEPLAAPPIPPATPIQHHLAAPQIPATPVGPQPLPATPLNHQMLAAGRLPSTNLSTQTLLSRLTASSFSTPTTFRSPRPIDNDDNPFAGGSAALSPSSPSDDITQDVIQTLISQLVAIQASGGTANESENKGKGKEKEKRKGVGSIGGSCSGSSQNSSNIRVDRLSRSLYGEITSSSFASADGQSSRDMEYFYNGVDIDFDMITLFLSTYYDQESRDLICAVLEADLPFNVAVERLQNAGMPLADAFFILAFFKFIRMIHE